MTGNVFQSGPMKLPIVSFSPKCVVFCIWFFVLQLQSRNTFIEALNPGVKRELWQAIPGDCVVNLTSSSKYQSKPPNIMDTLTTLDAPMNIGDEYGQKLTTYFLAPETGNYSFLMSCDQSCQLWISRDVTSLNAKMVLEVEPPGRTSSGDWKISKSPIFMEDNNFYFLQVLMKEQNGTDFISVGVVLPQGSSLKPIREPYLFLESPEQLAGSFILTENAVVPLSELVRSYPSVSQSTCAHYCIRYHNDCKSYSYHVFTRECLLYNVTIARNEMRSVKSDSTIRSYNKM